MNYSHTFLDIQKECFQLRGELQNNSITGVNQDEQDLMKKLINRTIREIAITHPPFMQIRRHLRLQPSIALQDSSVDSATGSKNRPFIYDTGSNLKNRDKYRVITNGTYKYLCTDISGTGTTYTLDTSLVAEATTGQSFTAYKVHCPLPHDMGDIHNIFYEDGESELYLATRAEYQQQAKKGTDESRPLMASVGIFTPNEDYKKQETGVTATNGSRLVSVSDGTDYDMGDVVLFDNKYLHTVTGLSTTDNNLYLDRNYTGTTTCATVDINPRGATEYISLYGYPTTEKDIIIDGYIKAQDMVADTDLCYIPDALIPAVVIGALIRDKLGREFLSQQYIMYYDKVFKELKSKKTAQIQNLHPPNGWRNRRSTEYSFGF